MTRKLAVWAALWLVFAAATPAKASAILTITEGASGVVVSGGGSFDLSDLTKFGFGDSAAGLAPSRGHVLVGPVVGGGETDFYAD